MAIQTMLEDEACAVTAGGRPTSAIWLLCHYPETREADERIKAAAAMHRDTGLPIWLSGTSSARYPASVEHLFKEQLLAAGVPEAAVRCSHELGIVSPSLDTVQEAENVSAVAGREGVTTLIGVSNRLQLLQVRGLFRGKPVRLVAAPVPLRDWRWWYVAVRLLLIPLAFLGIGRRFPPLMLVRRARASLASWPF
jgi:hypothetical protein